MGVSCRIGFVPLSGLLGEGSARYLEFQGRLRLHRMSKSSVTLHANRRALSRIRTLTCIAFTLAATDVRLSAAEQVTKQTEFGLGREAGSGLEELSDGSCIFFRVFFISDNFFSDMKRSDTAAGLEFKKAGKPVKFFPSHLIVDVEANIYRCGKDPVQQAPLNFKSDLMQALSFRAQWKREFDLRAADVVSVRTHGPVVHLFANRWEYYLDVPTKDIPLRDSFVIDVLNGNGETIRRISARL
jgi:hypothetical protein